MTAAASGLSDLIPALIELAIPERNLGLLTIDTSRPLRARATALGLFPTTTKTSAMSDFGMPSATRSTKVFPPRRAVSLLPPNLEERPAARTIADTRGPPLGAKVRRP